MSDAAAPAAPAAPAKSRRPVPTREPRKRTRSPPPASPKGRSRRELPTHAVEILKAWLTSPQHFHHPYPTPEDQQSLMAQTGAIKQLKTGSPMPDAASGSPCSGAASHDYDEGTGATTRTTRAGRRAILAFASAADRARRDRRLGGLVPTSHPAEGGRFDDFVPTRRRFIAAAEARAHGSSAPAGAFCRRGRVDTPRPARTSSTGAGAGRGDGHDARLPAVSAISAPCPRDGGARRGATDPR